jgi:hypothetical protein
MSDSGVRGCAGGVGEGAAGFAVDDARIAAARVVLGNIAGSDNGDGSGWRVAGFGLVG